MFKILAVLSLVVGALSAKSGCIFAVNFNQCGDSAFIGNHLYGLCQIQ